MIEVGESTGALPQMLSSVAEFYEDDVNTRMTASLVADRARHHDFHGMFRYFCIGGAVFADLLIGGHVAMKMKIEEYRGRSRNPGNGRQFLVSLEFPVFQSHSDIPGAFHGR